MLLRHQVTCRVRNAYLLDLRHHVAALAGNHAAMLLRHQVTCRVRNAHLLHFWHHIATPASNHATMLFGNHVASRVGDAHFLDLGNQIALSTWEHAAVLFTNPFAGGVAVRLHDRIGYEFADCIVDSLAMFALHEMAAANGPHLCARHPDALAYPMAGALHCVMDDLARTVTSAAGARIKDPFARHLTALLHDRAWAIALFHLPAAGADRDGLFSPYRFIGTVGTDLLPYFRLGAIASDRHLTSVFFIHRTIRAIVLWHLIFLPHRLIHGIAAFADMLLVDRVIGAVILRHLVFLPTHFICCVAAFADVLLVNRPADGVFLHDVKLLIDWFAYGVALRTDMLLVNRPVANRTAFLQERTIDRTIANTSPVFIDGLVADAITNGGHAALFGAATLNRVATGAAVRRSCRVR